MIPAGYLLKHVPARPDWLSRAPISDLFSVARCINEDVVDLQEAWRQNTFGVANSPQDLWDIVKGGRAESDDSTLFYYEAYEEELESDGWTFSPAGWRALTFEDSGGVQTDVTPPAAELTTLAGYDVVVFESGFPSHSPLSCNSIAAESPVNAHCLFDSLEAAKFAIDSGVFGGGCEEGVYRIFSVHVVAPATA